MNISYTENLLKYSKKIKAYRSYKEDEFEKISTFKEQQKSCHKSIK